MQKQDRAFLYHILSRFAEIANKGQEHVKAVAKTINTLYENRAEKLYQEGFALRKKLPEREEKERYEDFLIHLAAFGVKLKLYQEPKMHATLEELAFVNEYTTIIASNAKKG